MCLSSFTFHRWEHSGQKRVPESTRFFGQLQHPLHKVRHVKFDPIAGKTQFPGLKVSAVNSLSGSTGFIENSFAAISHGRLNMVRVISRTSFGSQMRHNFSQSIGINLSVPLFDAFGTRNSVRRARLAGESARLRVDDTRNTLYKAICQAHSQAMAAYQKRTAAAAALESAREAFRAVSIKYENGRANATELEKAKSDYITAMAESVRARYESILRSRILLFYNGDR